MRIGVIGAGSWGTTLADLLARKGEQVMLWAFEPEVAEEINLRRLNSAYLPDVELSPHLRATAEPEEAADRAEVLVMVCPSHTMRALTGRLREHLRPGTVLVSASKGLENESLLRMSQVIGQALEGRPDYRLVCLSGPSFALEVARSRPTVITAASEDEEAATLVQALFSTAYFRVYKHNDLVGVELGGSLKNVIAIATGMIEGIGLGMNTRAALITRGLAEITRLGVLLGARPDTFAGISGMGDLVLTCTGDLSRNRSLGIRIGRGERLEDVQRASRSVAEGVRTTKSAHGLALRHGIELPITAQVHRILFQGQSVREALRELMTRELKEEIYL